MEPVHFVVAPKGHGSAEQWVRKQLPEEARKHRRQANYQAHLALVVMTDGDCTGVVGRQAAFDAELSSQGQDERQPSERIAYLVPTWSIETWLAGLCDVATELGGVDEVTAYKDLAAFRRLLDAGRVSVRLAVSAWTPSRPAEDATVPSLLAGRRELERLP